MNNLSAYEIGRKLNFVGSMLEGPLRTIVRELLIPLIFIFADPNVGNSFSEGFLTKFKSGKGEPSLFSPGPDAR